MVKHLTIDCGVFLETDKMPSTVFKKWLISKIENSICELLENKNHEQVFDTICLCFHDDDITYFTPLEDDYGNHYIRVNVKHKSSWMGIGYAYIMFHNNGVMMMPWEKSIPTGVCDVSLIFPKDQLRNIKSILPQLYRTVVKHEQSGLPFDYEMTNTNEGILKVTCDSNTSDKDIYEICSAIERFIEAYNQDHKDFPIHYYERQKSKKGTIRYKIDLGGTDTDVIRNCILSLSNFKIKKIVFS